MNGNEWGPVVINSEEEFNITLSISSLLGICGLGNVPLVGGSINQSAVFYHQDPELYFPNNLGKCKNAFTMLILLLAT